MVAELARALVAVGEQGEAEAKLRESLEKEPSSTASRVWLAKLLRDTGRPEEAVSVLLEVPKMDGWLAQVYSEAGLSYLDTDRFADAEDMFKTAAKADPASSLPRMYLVIALMGQGKTAEAMHELENLMNQQPSELVFKMFLKHLAVTRVPVGAGTG